jgi:hypothetical protein
LPTTACKGPVICLHGLAFGRFRDP